MKGRAIFLLTAVVLAVLASTGVGLAESSSASQQQTSSLNQNPNVTVMTRNVYHGVDAELNQVATATFSSAFLSAVANVYKGYYARNFPERADALAAEIEQTEPDVVGLQEAIMVRTDTPPDGSATLAEQVSLDYLQILLDKLQARGLHYEPVDVPLDNWDIEVPADENSDGRPDFDLRHTDRIVMLVRNDGNSGLKVLKKDSGHFQTNCKLTTATGQQITIVRGWTSVDLSIGGKPVRFINTHLDGDCSDPAINLAQAQEI